MSGIRYVTTAAAATAAGAKRTSNSSGRRRWSAVLLFIPGLSAFGLGSWQLMRREWKTELLDHRRERLKDDVVPIGVATASVQSNSKQDYKDVLQHLEYRRVKCEGVFQDDKSIFLGPRGRANHGVTERGYFLITPLVPTEGDNQNMEMPVLVNRGWVPGSWRDNPTNITERNGNDSKPASQETIKKEPFISLWSKKKETMQKQPHSKTTTTVIAVVRDSETPNMFVPPNEPSSGQWFFVDIPAMVRAVGLPEGTIYVEALQDKSVDYQGKKYPNPKDPETLIRSSVMPNDHLSYAFTWFALSAATTFMAWKRLSK